MAQEFTFPRQTVVIHHLPLPQQYPTAPMSHYYQGLDYWIKVLLTENTIIDELSHICPSQAGD